MRNCFLFLLLIFAQSSKGAMPSAEEVGKIFGYPGSELIVEENTPQERIVIGTPSWAESVQKAMATNPENLLKSYLIRSRNERSFFPLQCYIGKKGSFLTEEVAATLAKEDDLADNRDIFGTRGFERLGRGGVYFREDYKVKASHSGEARIGRSDMPDSAVAFMMVVQPQGSEFDVQIAQIVNFDLEPAPGGESYFENFGPQAEPKAVRTQNLRQIYSKFCGLVIQKSRAGTASESSVAEKRTSPLPNPTSVGSRHQDGPTPTDSEPESQTGSSSALKRWFWILALAAVLMAVAALWRIRRSCPD